MSAGRGDVSGVTYSGENGHCRCWSRRERLAALNRTTRRKGRGMTSFGSRLGVGVAGVLIWLVLLLMFSLGVAGKAGGAESGSVQIKIDQVGYLPDGEKVAVVTAAAKTFEVKRATDNVAVFSGTLGPASLDTDTGDSVQIADFTKLRETGTYYLDVAGVGRSWTFAIKQDAFSHTYYLAMRAFYGQRCGTAVDLGAEFPRTAGAGRIEPHAGRHRRGRGCLGPRRAFA